MPGIPIFRVNMLSLNFQEADQDMAFGCKTFRQKPFG